MGIYSTKLKSLALLFALATFGVSAQSESAVSYADDAQQPRVARAEQVGDFLPFAQEPVQAAAPVGTAGILNVAHFPIEATSTDVKVPLRYGASRSASSIADITGVWLQSYNSATSTGTCGGGTSQFTQVGSTDSISISNFYEANSVKAAFDAATGKLYIPAQQIMADTIYGTYDVAWCDPSSGKPDRTKPITASINDDGTITIDDLWGVYINEGKYADLYIAVQCDTKYVRSNGTMTFTRSGNTYTRYIRLEQPSANVVTVTNVLGYGRTIEMVLNRNRTATIASQLVRQVYMTLSSGSTVLSNFYSIACTSFNDAGSLTGYDATITTEAATDNKTISWTDWSILSTEANMYYGNITDTKVTSSVEISYPELSVSEFTGEGTEASPYVITKLDELILLGDKVNEVTEMNAVSTANVEYARVFIGKYFRLDSDIDMSGYRFDPIGKDWKHVFAGNFDGNGHTISGLTIEPTASATMTGLFGRVDTFSVIKDLTIKDPYINSSYYTGALAGWSLGTIENCHVVNPTITNSSTATGALVGIGATIKNCTVTGGVINALGGYGGGLAGEVDRSTVSNCHVYGTKIVCSAAGSNYSFGGLVGTLYFSNLEKSSFAGTVDANSKYVACTEGGVAGTVYSGSVDQCFAVGSVLGYGTGSRNGGIVGHLTGSSLTNSYFAGRLYGYSSTYTGGLTGYNAVYTYNGVTTQNTIKNCYTSAEMLAETYGYDTTTGYRELFGTFQDGADPTFENVYFDRQMTNFGTPTGSTMTSKLTSATGPDGFDSSVWSFNEGYYPTLKWASDNKATALSRAAILFDEYSSLKKVLRNTKISLPAGVGTVYYKAGSTDAKGYYSSIVGDSLIVGEEIGSDTLFLTDGTVSYYHILGISPVPFEGGGTQESPYLIKTKEDLIKLSQITTVNKQYFEGSYFLMTNDIDLEYDTNFVGICADASDAHCQFAGVFDGGGHAVHRMKLSGFTWATRPEDAADGFGTPNTGTGYISFVGRLDETGVVRNLTMAADCDLSQMWATAGGIVGYLAGTVEDCRNYADITAYSCWVGGIAGQTNGYTAVIRNCYNEGNITTGYFAAGGIIGSGNVIIENCVNAGDIRADHISTFPSKLSSIHSAGGIIGTSSGSKLTNVVNSGNIFAYTSKAGGLAATWGKVSTTVGYQGLNEIINAVNYGMVSTPDLTNIGALTGTSGTEGTTVNALWDAQIITLLAHGNANLEGAKGVETATLTSSTAPEGFDTDIWQFDAGLYPTLKAFADEPKMAARRKMIVNIPSGSTVADLRTNATLASVDSLTWSLADGSVFSIEGNTLKAPVSVKAVVTDTLTLAYKSLTKDIVISAAPLVPLQGAGTQESPYLINTAADWNAFADYLASVGDSFEDKYLKVTADIAFSSETPIQQVAIDGVTSFAGSLDGDNHTLSGIDITTTASYQGIFGTVNEQASISNLTLEGTVKSAYTYTAALAGKLAGKLSNITNLVDVTTTKSYTAGVVAYLNTGAVLDKVVNKGTINSSATYVAGIAATSQGSATFTSCVNLGTIKYTGTTTTAVVGGLVGLAKSAIFTDCYNDGEFELASTASCVGGIAAVITGDKGSDPSYLTNCYNASDITAAGLVAGIVASPSSSTSITAGNARRVLTNCYNLGDITAAITKTTSNYVAAGIMGRYTAGDTLRYCHNEGTITNVTSVYAGGLLGSYMTAGTTAYPVLISNCYNTGDINASGNQGGGLVGYMSSYMTIDSCYNAGNVEGASMVGGLVSAFAGTNPVISNSYNTGNVSGTLNRIGGINGWGNPTNGQIINCWNSGNIKTSCEVKGVASSTSGYAIGGISGATSATLTNCHNTGSVTGASQVGGLVGQPTKDKTSFVNCYNAGRIIADADTCGAIVGVNTANGKIWTENNKVENTYYVSDLFKSENPQVGTAVTLAELAKLDMGDDWTSADDYSLPLTKHYADYDAALVNSATVVPADGETWDNIVTAFHLGLPEGVTWSANALVSIEGNVGTPTGNGTVTLTAKKGEFSKKVTLTLGNASGINAITADKTVVDEVYYTTSGVRIAKPTVADGQVYIVVATYTDGTVKSFKVVNR